MALYLMVSFSMTFTDYLPGFQSHGIFEVEYFKKRCVLGTRLRQLYINHN